MTLCTGPLFKMNTQHQSPVEYTLPIGSHFVALNPYIGQEIRVEYQGQILCINCGKPTKKSFFQGYCYPCFMRSPHTSECIINPELCRAHEGGGKDPEWEDAHHNQPHTVYLAKASGIKVGVTRDTQIPTRWIDQGASEAVVFAQTPNRYLAGCIEVAMKNYLSDKTHWQAMLKHIVSDDDLLEKKAEMAPLVPSEYAAYIVDSAPVISIDYPALQYPEKIKSINFDKVDHVEGRLTGIKGQYLLFGTGQVLNIRKHGGYVVTLVEL